MAKQRSGLLSGSLAFLVLAGLPLSAGQLIYSTVPNPLPPNVPSLGYQATQTAEFGDLIDVGQSFELLTATVVMSDWALASDFASSDPGWSFPITLNLYNVDNGSGTPEPGSVIASVTQTFSIPWRPAADPTCPGGTAWRAGNGSCYNGFAFPIEFDLTGIVVPSEFIYGVAYNTETWGLNPIGQAGPYNSLNFGLSTLPPTVGSKPFPDTAYWNTQTAGNYSDGGLGGTGTFRQDTAWTPFSGSIEFTATPEPGTTGLALAGGLLGLLGWARRRKQA